MGIINQDPYNTTYGTSVTNTYISIGEQTIALHKLDNTNSIYELKALFSIWNDKPSRESGKRPYQMIPISQELNASQITGDLYTILYDQLKIKFPNHTDD